MGQSHHCHLEKNLSDLFEPYNLSGLSLPNRVVMAPMTRSRARNADAPDADTALYYRQRATAGLLITEGSQISQEGKGYLYTPGMYTALQVAGWKEVASAVHQAKGRIFAQLWHVGRNSHVSLQPDGNAPVGPTDEVARGTFAFAFDADGEPGQVPVSKPRALETSEVKRLVLDFVAAADRAIGAGMDGIELHAANGYVFEQFINGGINRRADEYGGQTIQSRLRFTLETVDAVVARIGRHRTGIRLAPYGRLFDMPAFDDEQETWLTLARELSARDLAYVHLSDQSSLGMGGQEIPPEFLKQFRDAYRGTLILAGGFNAVKAQDALDRRLADLVAFGVPFIANPDLVDRMRSGWPLAEADRSTFYGGGNAGYIDYPPHSTLGGNHAAHARRR